MRVDGYNSACVVEAVNAPADLTRHDRRRLTQLLRVHTIIRTQVRDQACSGTACHVPVPVGQGTSACAAGSTEHAATGRRKPLAALSNCLPQRRAVVGHPRL
jgi:hypothetical protein